MAAGSSPPHWAYRSAVIGEGTNEALEDLAAAPLGSQASGNRLALRHHRHCGVIAMDTLGAVLRERSNAIVPWLRSRDPLWNNPKP